MRTYFLLIIFFIYSNLFSQQGWFFLNPTPTGNPIVDIKMLNESIGICMTSNEILRTTNGGLNWYKIYTPWANKNINLQMFDQTGFILLDSGKIVKTTNGGLNWYYNGKIQRSNIQKIFFKNSHTGYAAGAYNTILKTTNGGESWEEKLSGTGINNIFFSGSTGYAVGYQYYYPDINKTKIYKSTDNGNSWDSIANNMFLRVNNLVFVNQNTGFVWSTYEGQLMKTTDGGYSWNNSGNVYLGGDLVFSGTDTGYAVSNSVLLKTTNCGLNWTQRYIENLNGASVYKVSVFNNKDIIAGANTGELLKSSNGGLNWVNNTKSILNANLVEVEFCDKNTGYISGDRCVFKTTNGGNSFDTLRPPLNISYSYFYSMDVVNQNTVYGAIGERVYKTTNAGLNWSISTPFFNGFGILKIKFINENTGFGVCKRQTFIKTTNGGTNWTLQNILSYDENWSVDFFDENTGMAGGVWLVRTSNGGINWDTLKNIHSGTFIKYVSRDTVFVATYGGINKSTNGGNDWVFTPLPGLSYSHLEFPNSKTGYLSCYNTMYKTTNCGDNWFQINSGLGGYSYSTCFSMTDSLTGYMVGNYRAILKTTDGGGAPSFIPNFPAYLPDNFYLYQNYPNPFNPTTKIKFDLPKDGNVKIIIFDIIGREIEKLADEKFSAGVHELQWNAAQYSAGVYFYMLLTDNIKETRKMILVK